MINKRFFVHQDKNKYKHNLLNIEKVKVYVYFYKIKFQTKKLFEVKIFLHFTMGFLKIRNKYIKNLVYSVSVKLQDIIFNLLKKINLKEIPCLKLKKKNKN